MHLVVLQLTADRKVRSDYDLVFYNQPRSPDGVVSLAADDRLHIRHADVAPDIACVVVAIGLDRLGHADYGVLERLDEMSGRIVDNAGFVALTTSARSPTTRSTSGC